MKLERLDAEKIPKDLSEHWQALQDEAGMGHLHTDVGMKEEHQRLRLARVAELSVAYAHMGPHQGTALEIGCCEGVMTSEMAPNMVSILAVDFVQTLLDVCPKLPNVTYQLQDISTWDPVAGSPFDVTIVSEVLEHLVDPIGVLRRLADHTYYVVASCPVNEELNHDTAWSIEKIRHLLSGEHKVEAGEGAGHIWAMDMEGFEYMFEAAGYEIHQSEIIEPSGIIAASPTDRWK